MEAGGQGPADTRGGEIALDELLLAPSVILEGLPDAVVASAADGRIVFVNRLAEELFGYAREELVGQPVETLWPERLRELYSQNMELCLHTDEPLRFASDARGLKKDGSEFVGQMSWGAVQSTAGPLMLAIGRDISERHASERRFRALAALAQQALASADPAVLATDALELMQSTLPIDGGEVHLANGALLAASGRRTDVTTAHSIGSGDQLLLFPKREFSDEEMSLAHAVSDILGTALARMRGEERMRHDALHDPLTGLANRTLMRDRLEQALARSRRRRAAISLLFVDLDNFKQVNDERGHPTGDAVLVEFGRRLRNGVRPTDTVARLGGDEFVVVSEGLDEQTAVALGRRLHDALEEPLMIDGIEYRLSASIGIARGESDPDALLGNADAAVYRAKAHGRGRVELFQPASRQADRPA
jgi:diguanylate cyclase (GGDEF)-like protein/PAS domain S-box-containing protein